MFLMDKQSSTNEVANFNVKKYSYEEDKSQANDFLVDSDNQFQDYLMQLIKKMSVKIEKKSTTNSYSDSSKKGKASPEFTKKI